MKKFDISHPMVTISTFSKLKGVSPQNVTYLLNNGLLDYLAIDGVRFVYLNQRAIEYTPRKSTNFKDSR